MLPTIEFTFNYPTIDYARIEQWLDSAWYQYAFGNGLACVNAASFLHKARAHDYEN